MNNEPIEVRYYNTYYYANFVFNLLSDRWEYMRVLHELFEDQGELAFIQPFEKYSALHKFIQFAIELMFNDDLDSEYTKHSIEKGKPRLPINHAFEFYEIEHTTFDQWLDTNKAQSTASVDDQLYEYYHELKLEEAYDHLVMRLVDETFFIMFLNRDALLLLNDLIAGYISDIKLTDLEQEDVHHFMTDGVLKRTYIPQWARKAVFYRDRGACVICKKDLSGVLNISSEKHFDHIVALEQGGINDVTNLQILCDACNLKKGGGEAKTSDLYERWYSLTE